MLSLCLAWQDEREDTGPEHGALRAWAGHQEKSERDEVQDIPNPVGREEEGHRKATMVQSIAKSSD